MLLITLKTVHILAAMLFFGTGLGSVFYKMRADGSGDIAIIAWCQRAIVLADWLFTVPSAVVLPTTGLWMALARGIPVTSGWVLWGLVGYAVAGLAWLPAAFLQIRMRDLAQHALDTGEPLSPDFHRYRKIWLALGFPSFIAAMTVIYVMVFRNAAFTVF